MPSEITVRPSDVPPSEDLIDAQSFGEKLRLRRQNVLVFGAVLLLVCGIVGGLHFWSNETAALFLQTVLLLVLGYLHALILTHGLSLLNEGERWLYSLGLMAVVVVIVGGISYVSPHFSYISVVVCGCVFLLPWAMLEGWLAFETTTLGEAVPWYPTGDLHLRKATTFLNSIPVRFVVQIDQYEKMEQQVSFRAPVRMKLGLIFYHMLQDQKSNSGFFAEIAEQDDEAYGWVFYRTGFLGGSRYLNPEAGLLENGLKENAVVKARRFRRDEVG